MACSSELFPRERPCWRHQDIHSRCSSEECNFRQVPEMVLVSEMVPGLVLEMVQATEMVSLLTT